MNSNPSNPTYIKLNELEDEMALNETEINVYGAVIEASFPYQTEKSYVVTCKIIDESSFKAGEYINVLFLAREFEQLPIIQRKGDILRIHRGSFGYFKD